MHPQEALRQFKESLVKVIDKQQFEVLFKDALQPKIDRDIEKKWGNFKKNYPEIGEKEIAILYKIITHYTADEVFTDEFYNYDGSLAYKKLNSLYAERDAAIQKALTGLNLAKNSVTSKSQKVQYFINKAKQAGVKEPILKELLSALSERDQKVAQVDTHWKKFDQKYIVYYHDNKTTKDAYLDAFKNKMKQLITLEQFKIMFGEQFKERIDRKVLENLNTINNNYVLQVDQQVKLKKFLEERVFDEVTTYNFYGYDHKAAMQKLRAIQYKYDKEYQSLIKSMNAQLR